MMFSVKRDAFKVLDFDIENRPLAYWYDGNTTAEITAIGWAWYDLNKPHVETRYLEPPPDHEASMMEMLQDFARVWREADMVTGHYIRVHDIPILNAHMIEFGLEPLGPKLTSDTKLDLIRRGSFSASQMALSKVLEVTAEKPRMENMRWRDANRLTPEGIKAALNRVRGDVVQHMEMRQAMMDHRLLKEPRVWVP